MHSDLEVAREAVESMGKVLESASTPSVPARTRLTTHKDRLSRLTQRVEGLEEGRNAGSDIGVDVLEESEGRLVELQRLGSEAEQSGAQSLSRLRAQRDQLEHADTTLGRIDQGLSRARSLLFGMLKRAVVSKVPSPPPPPPLPPPRPF